MLAVTLISLGVVFVAVLGDRSQLITETDASHRRWWVLWSGVGITAFLVHGLSVTVGHFPGLPLPDNPFAFAAAIAFVLSASVGLADVTVLAGVAMAGDHSRAGVWIGAAVGMVLVGGVAVAAGAALPTRLPERSLHILAGVLFLLVGLWMLFNGVPGGRSVAVAVTVLVALAAVGTAVFGLARERAPTPGPPAARESSPQSA